MRNSVISCGLAIAAMAFGQGIEPRFEVASVRPTNPNSPGGLRAEIGEGRVMLRLPFHMIVAEAYDLPNSQPSVAPGLGPMMLRLFDIQAKAETAAGPRELRLMLQTLLKERFGMKSHFEQRMIPGFVMTAARSGLKAVAASGSPATPPRFTFYEFTAENAPLADIVAALARRIYRPVEDQAEPEQRGGKGRYTFSIKFDGATPPQPDEILDRIGQELGVRFAERNVNARTLVIDHLEAPSEN